MNKCGKQLSGKLKTLKQNGQQKSHGNFQNILNHICICQDSKEVLRARIANYAKLTNN